MYPYRTLYYGASTLSNIKIQNYIRKTHSRVIFGNYNAVYLDKLMQCLSPLLDIIILVVYFQHEGTTALSFVQIKV